MDILVFLLMEPTQLRFFLYGYSVSNKVPLSSATDHGELSLQMKLPFAPAFTDLEF